jgi:glycosyltransferase involved in cell wall biosynthesis
MGPSMRIALITDVFPPLRSSGAVQLRDLAVEFVRQGHKPTVMVASPNLECDWLLEEWQGVEILRLKAPRTKETGYVRRTIGEVLMPYMMLRNLRKSRIAATQWDGVVWYSPSIFLGPMAKALKRSSACRSYLIIRDIFPQWAVDMGLMGRGLPYLFFKIIEQFQYAVADVIGVQTPGNLAYFQKGKQREGQQTEVLQNWLAETPATGCSISIADGPLRGRKIFVYAGNMGIAQGMDSLLELVERLQYREDIGFVFVGRGSDAHRLRKHAGERNLQNVLFYEEIDPVEVPALYAQCHVGLVALDRRHKTHNIPGKFLSYVQAGLPVLASINNGNDLADVIEKRRVGRVCTDHDASSLQRMAASIIEDISVDPEVKTRCHALAAEMFAPEVAVRQICAALVAAPVDVRSSSASIEYGHS